MRVDALALEIPDDLVSSALRFWDTCEDGQCYEVPRDLMRRLSDFGLVKHVGGGRYMSTDILIQLVGRMARLVQEEKRAALGILPGLFDDMDPDSMFC